MKRISLVFTLCFLIVTANAQSLQTGVNFYEEGNYEEALRIFDSIEEPTSYLFSGKSYFALNNYLKAKKVLNKVDSTNITSEIFYEAKYTKALADFELQNFSASLDALFEINQFSTQGSVKRDAFSFYRDLLNYLTLEQRFSTFKGVSYDEIRFDLVDAAIGIVDYPSAKSLYTAYTNTVQISDSSNYENVFSVLKDSASYAQRYNPNKYTQAPTGLSYNIGVALPEFDMEADEFEITQHLYFGIQLAVERFNSQNNRQKAFLTYRNTDADVENAAFIANDLIWNHGVDAIIGPLFSEVALELSKYAEMYETPLLTPLANSDNINLDLNYTFQLNPTFAIQGQEMARYAIQTLRYDTLAVLAEKGSLGEASAYAFLDEVRNLGGEVVRFYVEDLASEGYDISEYVKYFDPEVDTVFNYNIDAVYAPFTGNIAQTLMSSLITNLEAMGSEMSILGSEEWETANINSGRLPETNVYYTKSFEIDSTNSMVNDFESEFRLRFESQPNQFAYIGYDAASVLLESLQRVQNPEYLKEGLKSLNNYRGLINRVSFDGSRINQNVKIKRLSNSN
ncbi:ABC transporter substrate-binding protein [Gracilimonas amylolytica]|uniref:ABC transporter substrate-binding protein n=1 Tax=Gracilimonas amylolytica TaxID=1749045 RepID=UPI0012FFE430|nr:ABC transporter substrate-binding protein [Gracilimonas amylolytica]